MAITLSAFIFNTSEFMPIGLLTDIAADFSMTEAAAGMLISVYAWMVMLLSLPLMLLVSKVPPKLLIVGVVALFAVCQFGSAAASSFALLMAARIGVACAHAVFWSIASVLATRIVPDRAAPLALSMIATGTSVAMIFGLPLGRMLGLAIGWRMTFLVVGVVALAVVACLLAVFPRLEVGAPFSTRQLPQLFRRRSLVAIYVATMVVIVAYFTGYGHIEPFMQQVANLPDGVITAALMVFGAAGMAGSFLFARFSNVPAPTFVRLAVAGIGTALLLMAPAAAVGAPAMFAVCVLWGMAANLFNVVFQAVVIRCAPEGGTSVAMSIYSGLYNFGIGSGTWLGGTVSTVLGLGAIGWVGGVVAVAGFAFVCLRLVKLLRTPQE